VLRASDAERDEIVQRLNVAVGEGRSNVVGMPQRPDEVGLTLAEFSDRVDSVYGSRTRGELVPLVADLPTPGSAGRAALPPAGGPQAVVRSPDRRGTAARPVRAARHHRSHPDRRPETQVG
jgi:hypothetical protein